MGQLLQQRAPLLPEDVGPGEAAVPADHTQVGDAPLHQVLGGFQAAFPGAEGFAPGAANDGPALGRKPNPSYLSPAAVQKAGQISPVSAGADTGLPTVGPPWEFIDPLFLAPSGIQWIEILAPCPRGPK